MLKNFNITLYKKKKKEGKRRKKKRSCIIIVKYIYVRKEKEKDI